MSSFGNDAANDRLAALRAPVDVDRRGRPPRTRRPELLVAAAAVVVGLAILIMLALPKGNRIAVADETSSTLATTNNSRIPAGLALMAFPVEQGHLPPSLQPGDRVRIVATPAPDGSGSVRVLGPVVTIESIDVAGSMDGSTVVSVIADESVAGAVAASGPVHVFLVGERP